MEEAPLLYLLFRSTIGHLCSFLLPSAVAFPLLNISGLLPCLVQHSGHIFTQIPAAGHPCHSGSLFPLTALRYCVIAGLLGEGAYLSRFLFSSSSFHLCQRQVPSALPAFPCATTSHPPLAHTYAHVGWRVDAVTSSVPSVFTAVSRLRSSYTCRVSAANSARETAPNVVLDESHSLTQPKGKNHAEDGRRRGGGQQRDKRE